MYIKISNKWINFLFLLNHNIITSSINIVNDQKMRHFNKK
ncbi:hypothetical protein B4144_0674 [Bacillus atrophaeus]|nr:hypothetical protein B4144_0674 [Bacillus atrophaeus]